METNGLNPAGTHSAAIASWLTGGSRIPAVYNDDYPNANGVTSPVEGNANGAIVGYKYFNFDGAVPQGQTTTLELSLTPQGVDGTIDIMVDRPWSNEHNDGRKVGTIVISKDDPQQAATYTARVSGLDGLDGKHAIYLRFNTASGQSVTTLHSLRFGTMDVNADAPVTALAITGGDVADGQGSVQLGSTSELGVTVTPSDAADDSVTWTSSNPNVVAVNADGVVTGKALGTARVTATANDGSGASATAVIAVRTAEQIANASFDNGVEPWTVSRAADDSTAEQNQGYGTRYGDSGRSYNLRKRTYDGDAVTYPLAGKVEAGKTYHLSAQMLYKLSENPDSATPAQFNLNVVDGNGVRASVSAAVTRSDGDTQEWQEVAGDVTLPEGFDADSATLTVTSGDPEHPEAATTVVSFFLDQVSLKEMASVSSDATLGALTVAGQTVDLGQAANEQGATITVADPGKVGADDVTATANDAMAYANVTVNADGVTVEVSAQDGTTATYRVKLAASEQPVDPDPTPDPEQPGDGDGAGDSGAGDGQGAAGAGKDSGLASTGVDALALAVGAALLAAAGGIALTVRRRSRR